MFTGDTNMIPPEIFELKTPNDGIQMMVNAQLFEIQTTSIPAIEKSEQTKVTTVTESTSTS